MRTLLTKKLGLAEAEMKSIEHACQAEVEQAVEFALKSPEPDKEETYRHTYAEDQ
jgi:pyruvate dehydrogenase E1 component alpha subunit